ncbi:hepatic sodium/bile acid cotransporter [Procambarus clarkii]|uniref:hepatic sodium/bile acid cotransporter n=1 Tax=Procambarus clarkii TaxID=6728 RepID=UPI001E674366|nr:sodium/bile acid cotransporter-like [Procambarus clarkii]
MLLRLLTVLSYAALTMGVMSSGGAVYLETFHSGVWKVPEDTPLNLTLSLGFNASDAVCSDGRDLTEAWLEVTVVLDEDWKLDIVNKSVQFRVAEVCARVNKSLAFSGYYWGLTKLAFFLTHNDLDPYFTNATLLRDDLMITVDRKSRTLDTIFISIGSVFVLINNINMGAQLDLLVIRDVFRRPIGPVCGFISQFAVMPLATYTMGSVLFTDPLQRLGLFTLGCSPGGTSSNFWTLMFDGDINLSITMTAVSTVCAMGMMPLWMFTLGGKLLEDADIKIPFSTLAISLVSLTVPITIGIIIRLKRPAWAERGAKIIKPFSFFLLLFFITMGTLNSYKVMMLMTWQMVLAGMLVMASGYTFGAIFAKVMCLSKKQVIAVSIETALQNPGVAFVLLKLSLESPYSDLASVPIFSTLFMAGPPLILAFCVYSVLRHFCGCCPDSGGSPEDPPHTPHQLHQLKQQPAAAVDAQTKAGEGTKFLVNVEH